ncbi:unnamed protein product [Rotaria magnacalcarata]
MINSESRCRFYLPILSEYYSYENGLETHTSFIENGDINRLFYRRKSDSSATANLIRVLEKHAHGDCVYLNWRNRKYHVGYEFCEGGIGI